jgi:triphosphoribosyl-dephospho-CoA synthetase
MAKRGAYKRRGSSKYSREERRQLDSTNRLLYGRALRKGCDRFFSERGIPPGSISDNVIMDHTEPGTHWNDEKWET